MNCRKSSSRPAFAGRLLAVVSLLFAATAAYGHGGDSESEGAVRAVMDALPEPLADVRIQLRRTLAPQLLVRNDSDRLLTVYDDHDRAFLRIGDGQVQADFGAAAFHRTNTLMAPGAFSAGASQAPNWQVVEPEPNWGWFDLRLRTASIDVPHAVRDRGKRATLGEWSIPVQFGDSRSAIAGHFEYVPAPGGIPESRITDRGALPPATTLVRAMNGSARNGLFLSWRGDEPLIVYGVADEPLLHFDSSGVAANRHSATWQTISPAGAPDYEAGDDVDWVKVSGQSSYGWIDPRAGFTGEVESADEASILKRWSIPVKIGEQMSAIEGVTEWKPVKPVAKAH